MLGEPVGRRRPWGGNLPGFFSGAAAPGRKPTWLFLGAAPGEDYWLLFGALGRTVGGNLPGRPTGVFGALAEPSRNGLVPSLGAFTWCLHLVPSRLPCRCNALTPTAHTPTAHTPTASTPTTNTPTSAHSYHKHSYRKHSYLRALTCKTLLPQTLAVALKLPASWRRRRCCLTADAGARGSREEVLGCPGLPYAPPHHPPPPLPCACEFLVVIVFNGLQCMPAAPRHPHQPPPPSPPTPPTPPPPSLPMCL